MNKVRKVATVMIVALLLVSSVGTTVYYFNNLLIDKNLKISLLESQIENQTSEISGLNNQISTLQNQVANLMSLTAPRAIINSITQDSGWYAIVGVTTVVTFHVNVTNIGLQDLNGSNVVLQNLATFGNSVSQGTYSGSRDVPLIHPNQTTSVTITIEESLNQVNLVQSLNYIVTLNLNNTTLDTKYLYKSG